MIQIYTDGSCSNNKKGLENIGGIGIVILENQKIIKKISKTFQNTTNNKMELLAIIEALIYCLNSNYKEKEIIIYSDSQYCVQGASNWIKNWKKKQFSKSGGLANATLWATLDSIQSCFPYLSYQWVKGHNGDTYNEIADQLASNYLTQDGLL